MFFAWGGVATLFPATCTDYFGSRYATTNAGLLHTAAGFAGLLVPLSDPLVRWTGAAGRSSSRGRSAASRRRGHFSVSPCRGRCERPGCDASSGYFSVFSRPLFCNSSIRTSSFCRKLVSCRGERASVSGARDRSASPSRPDPTGRWRRQSFSFFTISAGVPAGAMRTIGVVLAKSLTPVSCRVGTSGSWPASARGRTTMARRRPPRIRSDRGRYLVDHGVDLAGQEIVQRQAVALVGDDVEAHVERLLHLQQGQVIGAAVAGMADGDLARIGAQVGRASPANP